MSDMLPTISMIDGLIVCCLTPLSTIFQVYRGGQCTYQCFLGVLLTSTLRNILSKHWLLSHITIVETTDSDEKGMNPVTMTKTNPRKEYWPSRGSNQRPLDLKSATQLTELRGSAPTISKTNPNCFI